MSALPESPIEVATLGTRLASEESAPAFWLGRIGFVEALRLQERVVCAHAELGDLLLLLEHTPVYTTGRLGRAENLPASELGKTPDSAEARDGLAVHRVSRGGDVTYHGPGQLVGYALVDLRNRGSDVHGFLRALEAGVIATLGALGLRGVRNQAGTGVWVEGGGSARKIASIGIGVRRGITMHGFALNVSLDLAPFRAIVPCGLAGVQMTSVVEELGSAPSVHEVAQLASLAVSHALAVPQGTSHRHAGRRG